ncbi:hypothetical protein KFK09_006976 [Dendrobium nobile]|uniref:Uncharacterized protein n=1 Tax=Dendrobium nobile TaxID=94219 RepID=A0A8T3BV13_DENNO|nr:hypothetical protein KFK09_006976 [Dendrobium nobile]
MGFGQRSVQKGDIYLHSQRVPVVASEQMSSLPIRQKGKVVERAKSNRSRRRDACNLYTSGEQRR